MSTPLATKPKTDMTQHQMEVLRIVIVGNDSPDPNLQLADLDQVLERVTKKTTKQAMQFTIRALIHNGMMLKAGQVSRRGRLRVVFTPTVQGRDVGEDRPATAAFIETDEAAELDLVVAGL